MPSPRPPAARLGAAARLAAAAVGWWRRVPWPAGRGHYFFKERLRALLGERPRPMRTDAGWLLLELAGDVLQERLYFSGRHDEDDVACFFEQNRASWRGATLFDIGGHVGYWALQLAKAAGPQGRVLAFEPQPELAAAITWAAQCNAVPWLEVVQLAVADRAGSLTLSRMADRGRSSVSELADAAESFAVPTLPLDSFCREKGIWPDLLKIDIEGAEWLALAGMKELLAERRPQIVLEVHPRQIAALGGSQEALVEQLRAAGYQLEQLLPNGRAPLSRLPQGSAWHLLATPLP